jgi:hypothetical protein
VIAGLIERHLPGRARRARQVTVSTDLVYDVLRRHEPDHVLLKAARADAATGLLDVRRLGVMLGRIRGRIIHKALDRVSPLGVSVILEIGRERVYGENADEILAEAERQLWKRPWRDGGAAETGHGGERGGALRGRGHARPVGRAVPPGLRHARWSPTCTWRRGRASPAAA